MTENEPSGIASLTAQTQQVVGQALRRIELAAEPEITRLPPRNVKELRGRTELFPQPPGAGEGITRLLRGVALDDHQDPAQLTAKLQLLSATGCVVRQQRQLVQPLLQLRRRFGHGRASDGPPTGLAPESGRILGKPRFGVMLSEKLGLVLHQLRKMSFDCLGDLR